MELLLARVPSQKTCALSALINLADSTRICYMLEDLVREVVGKPVASWKVDAKTAIPAGRYKVVWTLSNRFKRWMPELLAVPGFAGIRIHAGNVATNTEGCLIAGSAIGADGESVVNSRTACDALYALIQAELASGGEVWITLV